MGRRGSIRSLVDNRGLNMSSQSEDQSPEKRKKACYVGVPAIFKLELACQIINAAYESYGCYLVGSALERADWRDVDVVMIMKDDVFDREFPNAPSAKGCWEFDPKWLLNSITLSAWLTEQSGVPVDFKIQPQSHANTRHNNRRNAIGLTFAGGLKFAQSAKGDK